MPHALLEQIAGAVLATNRLRALTTELARDRPVREFCTGLRDRLGLRLNWDPAELQHIPAQGPAVVVVNHSLGLTDAVVTANVLYERRSDIRYLANRQVLSLDGVSPLVFPVELEDTPANRRGNAAALRQSLEWLDKGGLLVVFPAGVVAHWRWNRWGASEGVWNENAARLARRSGAAVVPMWVNGRNSAAFHLAGLAHPALRTALLPREFLRQRPEEIRVRIGRSAPAEWIGRRGEGATAYLRARCESLRPRPRALRSSWRLTLPVARAVPPAELSREVAGLPASARLAASGSLSVWEFTQAEAPLLLREIGVRREESFRAAGEGSGKPLDLDRFDAVSRHLVLWDEEARAVAGGYRLRLEPGGYSSTLFRIQPEFYQRLGTALELGRSFLSPAYQRRAEPLHLLWRAIGAVLATHPEIRALYGPVSISNTYSPLARATMEAGLRRLAWREDLAPFIEPRRRFLPATEPVTAYDLEELDAMVRDIDGRGIPVLIRQYLKLGGGFAGFHVDAAFGHTLDGLIVVERSAIPERQKRRYLVPPDQATL